MRKRKYAIQFYAPPLHWLGLKTCCGAGQAPSQFKLSWFCASPATADRARLVDLSENVPGNQPVDDGIDGL